MLGVDGYYSFIKTIKKNKMKSYGISEEVEQTLSVEKYLYEMQWKMWKDVYG